MRHAWIDGPFEYLAEDEVNSGQVMMRAAEGAPGRVWWSAAGEAVAREILRLAGEAQEAADDVADLTLQVALAQDDDLR